MQTIEPKISINDLIFLHQLGDSHTAEITKYEMAEMYKISVDEIDCELSNLRFFDEGN